MRALADRSKTAVDQIRSITRANARHVGDGNRVIEQTAAVLSEIIERIGEISSGVDDATHAIAAQGQGIDEVATSVGQVLDASTSNADAARELMERTGDPAEAPAAT